MTSPALQHKIAKLKALAPSELDKARLCARVILAVPQGLSFFHTAVDALKASQGANWSAVTAVQYLSGRRGEYAAQCATPNEKDSLLLAHLLAKQVCELADAYGAGALAAEDFAKWQRLVSAAAQVLSNRA